MTKKSNKVFSPKSLRALMFWHHVTNHTLKNLPIDLSTRQMAILLTTHLEAGPHSIKSLEQLLSISKPAICRALNVLEKEKLLRRTPDRHDKRNMHVLPTVKGHAFLSEFAGIIQSATKSS